MKFEVKNPHGFGIEYRPNKRKKTITLVEKQEEPDPEFERMKAQYFERKRKQEENKKGKLIDMENLL